MPDEEPDLHGKRVFAQEIFRNNFMYGNLYVNSRFKHACVLMKDTFKHKGLRKKLVETIRAKGIRDTRLLEAIGRVPRHQFVESFLENRAYEDTALPIEAGQTISQPYTVAVQTELLKVQPGDKILEVGTGSGYQVAILLEMGAKVFSIERHRKLYVRTGKTLNALGYYPKLFYGDGYKGLPTYGPFDKIVITAGAPEIPEALRKQLNPGGILVAPVGNTQHQEMIRLIKKAETDFIREVHGGFVFVPLRPGTG